MLSEKGNVAKNIHESLDDEFIKHQMNHNSFNLHETLGYIGKKMLELCAPIRDASIRALEHEQDPAAVMMKMKTLLEEMQLDLSNYRLQSVRPHLMHQAVEYEREKFDAGVSSGRITLTRTEAWLAASVAQLQKTADERNPENIEHPDLKVKYEDALNHAYLTTLFSKEGVSTSTLPEPLVMDASRLFAMQNEIQVLAIVSAICMLSRNTFSCFVSDELASRELKTRLMLLLKAEGTNVETLSGLIVSIANKSFERKADTMTSLSRMTSKATAADARVVTSEEEAMIKAMVEKTVSFRDPLFSLLTRRIQSVVKVHLERDVFRAETLKRHGLDVVVAELEKLSGSIVSLAGHNKKVHYRHYNAILEKLI
jgi:T-complex protein 11